MALPIILCILLTLVLFICRFADAVTDLKDDAAVVVNNRIRVGTQMYSFQSTVQHHGPMKSSGHYTCIVTCPDGSHVKVDDTKVRKSSFFIKCMLHVSWCTVKCTDFVFLRCCLSPSHSLVTH